jgi:ABC-2 type transport system permease protein
MLRREFTFLLALWKANLLAALEYRVSFILQIVGMMLNNGLYFVFWILFFERFRNVGGWGLSDMVLVFSICTTAYGLAVYLFGNVFTLAEVIAGGRLDYYLALPRPVLLHVLASRSITSGAGDFFYGVLTFALAGYVSPGAVARFVLGVLVSGTVFLSFLVLVQCLSFWLGNTAMLTRQAVNAILTFSLYPTTVFDGPARFLLLTIIPAAFVGAVPAEFVRAFSWEQLFELLAAALILLGLAVLVFRRGLRRYESGSAIQVQL